MHDCKQTSVTLTTIPRNVQSHWSEQKRRLDRRKDVRRAYGNGEADRRRAQLTLGLLHNNTHCSTAESRLSTRHRTHTHNELAIELAAFNQH